MREKLPKQLQSLVSGSLATLGKAIKTEYGVKTFNRVESIRKSMKDLRKANSDQLYLELIKEKKKFSKLSTKELEEITLSFSFMLELINRCESAYRSFKLGQRTQELSKDKPYAIIMVLTAHPTEARSPELLEIFSVIQNLLIGGLSEVTEKFESELYHLLMLGLKISIARRKKPSVLDEAHNIYSYILRKDILESLIAFSSKGLNLSLRAWVGGDKDGHPDVNEKTMKQSLNLSRSMLIAFMNDKMKRVENTLTMVKKDDLKKIISSVEKCKSDLQKLQKIDKNDGYSIVKFKKSFKKLCKNYENYFKVNSPRLHEMERLLWTFPALVVPLEIREDSEVVKASLKSKSAFPIEKMLTILKEISRGYKAKWYVRGFVLSMVESHTDILNGHRLIQKVFRNYEIPIVPLFENEKALINAKGILEELFKSQSKIPTHHIVNWGGRFEVMVGYSDSSKENGVLPSRLLISNALVVIENTLKTYKLTPVFFHGSGGSIERGGGSIKEQTSWWPKSALNIFKATIQGEMVARKFGNDKIFSSQIVKITEQLNLARNRNYKPKNSKVLSRFSDLVRENYSETIKNKDFLKVIDSATPYSFLSHLKIGSRPSKRTSKGDFKKLRAIPWILCWTQTRVLFPTWWGVGEAWSDLSAKEKSELKKEYKDNPLLSSYLNALGFTLAKVELGVWKVYLKESNLEPNRQKEIYEHFKTELGKAKAFYLAITGKKELLWFRPWLQESIDMRSSMIHPLNLIQLESLKRKEMNLLRDTVTGISCGMLTTG